MSSSNEMKNTLTILMAGGKGERLYPLTKARAKPSVRFGGIYRIVDFTLSNCLNSDIRRIYVLTQYRSLLSTATYDWDGVSSIMNWGSSSSVYHPNRET